MPAGKGKRKMRIPSLFLGQWNTVNSIFVQKETWKKNVDIHFHLPLSVNDGKRAFLFYLPLLLRKKTTISGIWSDPPADQRCSQCSRIIRCSSNTTSEDAWME